MTASSLFGVPVTLPLPEAVKQSMKDMAELWALVTAATSSALQRQADTVVQQTTMAAAEKEAARMVTDFDAVKAVRRWWGGARVSCCLLMRQCVVVRSVVHVQLTAKVYGVDGSHRPTTVGGLRRAVHMPGSASPHYVWVCETHWRLQHEFALEVDADHGEVPERPVRWRCFGVVFLNC